MLDFARYWGKKVQTIIWVKIFFKKLETDLTEMLSTQKVVHGIYMYEEKSHILTCKI